jgi:hypothetical protein
MKSPSPDWTWHQLERTVPGSNRRPALIDRSGWLIFIGLTVSIAAACWRKGSVSACWKTRTCRGAGCSTRTVRW